MCSSRRSACSSGCVLSRPRACSAGYARTPPTRKLRTTEAGRSWAEPGRHITLGEVVLQAGSGNEQLHPKSADAVRALAHARIGLDVPVETKFHAPDLRPEWVARPALTERLAGADARLVLVDAPASFGKTVAVTQWRSSTIENRPFAWVSLDQGDNDPSRLWWHVVCALQRTSPEFGAEQILTALRVQSPEITAVVLPILVNELAALPVPVVLVLDDYHVIREPACHEQLEFLLLHL